MTRATTEGKTPDNAWVDDWLSPARLSRYLFRASGDMTLALALYEWNTQISAALHRDLAHLEVALRNAYDAAASAFWTGPGHWLLDDAHLVLAPVMRTRRRTSGGQRSKYTFDVNQKPRELVAAAVRQAGGPGAAPGKVVAELNFGFWRYLSTSAHEKTLWVPMLHHAFPVGTRRVDVDDQLNRMHQLRNRAAHHEPLIDLPVADRLSDLLSVAELLQPELGAHIRRTSSVTRLLTERPIP